VHILYHVLSITNSLSKFITQHRTTKSMVSTISKKKVWSIGWSI